MVTTAKILRDTETRVLRNGTLKNQRRTTTTGMTEEAERITTGIPKNSHRGITIRTKKDILVEINLHLTVARTLLRSKNTKKEARESPTRKITETKPGDILVKGNQIKWLNVTKRIVVKFRETSVKKSLIRNEIFKLIIATNRLTLKLEKINPKLVRGIAGFLL